LLKLNFCLESLEENRVPDHPTFRSPELRGFNLAARKRRGRSAAKSASGGGWLEVFIGCHCGEACRKGGKKFPEEYLRGPWPPRTEDPPSPEGSDILTSGGMG
jgi:hypothetical protein